MLFLARFDQRVPERLTADLMRAHVEFLARETEAGRMRLCGAADDGTALFLLDCADRAEAEAIVRADPFVADRYYGAFQIVGFRQAAPENGFLLQQVLQRLASAAAK